METEGNATLVNLSGKDFTRIAACKSQLRAFILVKSVTKVPSVVLNSLGT